MKNCLIIIMLFLCGNSFAQIYTPTIPTQYGENQNRINPVAVLHLPEKDTSTLGTTKLKTQIFYNTLDNKIWGWSIDRGYFKMLDKLDSYNDSAAVRALIALKVNISDTSAMLSAYRLGINNNTIAISLRLRISDTSSMLALYRNAINTNTVSINQKINIADSASMLLAYRNAINANIVLINSKANQSALVDTASAIRSSVASIPLPIKTLSSISQLQSYTGSSTSILVTDSIRGGIFNYKATTSNPIDSGIVFIKSGGGYWIRDLTSSGSRVDVRWYCKSLGAADNWAEIQRAVHYCFGDTSTPHAQVVRNKELYFGSGDYYVSKPIYLRALTGALITGSGRFSTIIHTMGAGYPIFKTNGFEYSKMSGIYLRGLYTDTTNALIDLDWDGVSTYPINTTLQSNIFENMLMEANGYGIRVAHSTYMGSEILYTNCYFQGNKIAGVRIEAYNALQNTFMLGNFQSCGIGISILSGNANCYSVGFQAQTYYDISMDNSANDVLTVSGCRTESVNFLHLANSALGYITNCTQLNSTNGFFMAGGNNSVIDACSSERGIVSGGGSGGIIVKNSWFGRKAWLQGYYEGSVIDNVTAGRLPNSIVEGYQKGSNNSFNSNSIILGASGGEIANNGALTDQWLKGNQGGIFFYKSDSLSKSNPSTGILLESTPSKRLRTRHWSGGLDTLALLADVKVNADSIYNHNIRIIANQTAINLRLLISDTSGFTKNTATQTLINKTINSPIIDNPTITTSATITGATQNLFKVRNTSGVTGEFNVYPYAGGNLDISIQSNATFYKSGSDQAVIFSNDNGEMLRMIRGAVTYLNTPVTIMTAPADAKFSIRSNANSSSSSLLLRGDGGAEGSNYGSVGNESTGRIVFDSRTANAPFKYMTAGDLDRMDIFSSGGVGFGTNNVENTTAIGEFKSISKGFLIPRLTTTQMNNITSPALGLQLVNTTDSTFRFYNGSDWVSYGSLTVQNTNVSNISANTAAITTKVNSSDTASMLNAYKTAINTNTVSINQKINIADSASMLLAYRNAINTNTSNISLKQNLITITTTGTSGAATFNQSSGALNIPNYVAVSSVSSADGNATIATGTTTPVITIVSAPKFLTGRTIGITGDIVYTSPSFDGSGNITAAATLPTVNSNVGTWNNVTVNGKGLVTAGSNISYLTSYTETDPIVKAISGLVKSNGTVISAAVSGTDYEVPLIFSTGLLRTGNTVTNTITNNNQLTNGAGYLTSSSASSTYLPLSGGTLTGNLLFSTTNTLDIGASAGTRPRSLYLGTNLYLPLNGIIDFNSGNVLITNSATGAITYQAPANIFKFNSSVETGRFNGNGLWIGTSSADANNARLLVKSSGTSDITLLQNSSGVTAFRLDNNSAATFASTVGATTFNASAGLSLTSSTGRITVTTGSNSSFGNATLVGGTVTVTTSAATANSLIYLTRKTSGGTIGFETYTTTSGSFTITSANAADTSTFTYEIIN